jgi:hypothetical protein
MSHRVSSLQRVRTHVCVGDLCGALASFKPMDEDEVAAETVATAAAAAARGWDLSAWIVVIVIGAVTLALLIYGWRYFASSNKQKAALDQLLADVGESEGAAQSSYPWDTWQWEWQAVYRELDLETTSESRRRVVLVSRASECIANARAFDAAKIVRRQTRSRVCTDRAVGSVFMWISTCVMFVALLGRVLIHSVVGGGARQGISIVRE